jgi:hypothetical protein
MAREVHLEVTQPYHGPGGVLLFDVGHRFGVDDDLPEGIRTTPVVSGAPDPAPAKAEPVKPDLKPPTAPKGKDDA